MGAGPSPGMATLFLATAIRMTPIQTDADPRAGDLGYVDNG